MGVVNSSQFRMRTAEQPVAADADHSQR